MRRGQVFILMAFMIAVMLAELGNLYTYSALPTQTEQTKISDLVGIAKNIQNEVIYVSSINASDNSTMDDFMLFVGNFTLQRSYTTNYSS